MRRRRRCRNRTTRPECVHGRERRRRRRVRCRRTAASGFSIMANVYEPTWDSERDEPPYRWRRSRIGRQAGARQLGASLFELEPGAASFPLHIHYANEEMLVVMSGRPTLETLSGSRELVAGEAVACPAG